MLGTLETNQRTWATMWFPCNEVAAEYVNISMSADTSSYIVGETITEAVSGITAIVAAVGTDATQNYGDALVVHSLTGALTNTRALTGSLSGQALTYTDYTLSCFKSSTGKHFFGPKDASSELDFSSSTDWMGLKLGITKDWYGPDPAAMLGTKDFLIQVVAAPVAIGGGGWTFQLGTDGTNDTVAMTEATYKFGATLIQNGTHSNVGAGDIISLGMTRRNLSEAKGWRDGEQYDSTATLPSADQDIALARIKTLDLGDTAADARCYGILVATWPQGEMPSDATLIAGMIYHKTQWLAGNKVLTTAW